ncbi:hypothetical protein ABK040_007215 [Willaertia magna]
MKANRNKTSTNTQKHVNNYSHQPMNREGLLDQTTTLLESGSTSPFQYSFESPMMSSNSFPQQQYTQISQSSSSSSNNNNNNTNLNNNNGFYGNFIITNKVMPKKREEDKLQNFLTNILEKQRNNNNNQYINNMNDNPFNQILPLYEQTMNRTEIPISIQNELMSDFIMQKQSNNSTSSVPPSSIPASIPPPNIQVDNSQLDNSQMINGLMESNNNNGLSKSSSFSSFTTLANNAEDPNMMFFNPIDDFLFQSENNETSSQDPNVNNLFPFDEN